MRPIPSRFRLSFVWVIFLAVGTLVSCVGTGSGAPSADSDSAPSDEGRDHVPQEQSSAAVEAGLDPAAIQRLLNPAPEILVISDSENLQLVLDPGAAAARAALADALDSLALSANEVLAQVDLSLSQEVSGVQLGLSARYAIRLDEDSESRLSLELLEVSDGVGVLADREFGFEARVAAGRLELASFSGRSAGTAKQPAQVQPLIVPEVLLGVPLARLPEPVGLGQGGLLIRAPGLFAYQDLAETDESALRITDGSEELSGLLDPPGSIELRSRSEDGFFRPQSRVFFLVDGRQTESTGYGTNLALQSPVGPNTRLVGAPVLGADSYELLAGGSAYSENPGPRVSRADLPDFALPGYPSIVLTALNGGRPLLELSYALRPGHQPPSLTQVSSDEFSGQVMTSPLTNAKAAELLNSLLRQGHGRIRRSEGGVVDMVDSFSGNLIAGFGLLDYGTQFGLGLDEEDRVIVEPGREQHPVVGVSWIGAERMAWVLNVLDGLTPSVLPPRVLGRLSDDTTNWRLPSQAEWLEAARSPVGLRIARERVNYFRSFDPFEDPNPPHTRQGGPTNPVGYFPPDSVHGLTDTKGNTWEWIQDIVPPEQVQNLATGPVDQRFAYRRVAGGAWNSPLSSFGPRGLDIPLGMFAEDQSSWSIGIRYVRAQLRD